MLGKKRSPDACARISAAKKGVPLTVQARAKLTDAHRGRPGKPHSEAAKAKLRVAARARKPPSAATRARMAAAHMGRRHSDATRAKMRANHRGPLGAESIEKMRRSLTGRKLSATHRANIAAGLRQRGRDHG
jgi:hypothetical protein